MTELHIAVQFGDLKTVKRIYAPYVNKRDGKGNTALMLAVMKGDKEKVKFLLTVEDVTLRNAWGLTALDIALKMNNQELLALLKKQCEARGIDITASQEAVDFQFRQHVDEIKSYGYTDAELRRRTAQVAAVTGDVLNGQEAAGARKVAEMRPK